MQQSPARAILLRRNQIRFISKTKCYRQSYFADKKCNAFFSGLNSRAYTKLRLLGIYYQTTKKLIRDIEKSGVTGGDYSLSCIVEREKIYPDYYGLEMVIAVAFRVQSANAEVFRRWIYRRIVRTEISKIVMLSIQNSMLN